MSAAGSDGPGPAIIRCGEMEVDRERYLVHVAGRRVLVSRLRSKLGDGARHLHTVQRVG